MFCLYDALCTGLARYERLNPFTGEREFRIEAFQMGLGHFHLFVSFPEICFCGEMDGRQLLWRIRAMGVSFEKDWEALPWGN